MNALPQRLWHWFALLVFVFLAVSACSSRQLPPPVPAPSPTMGTRFVPPAARTTTEGWHAAQLLAEHAESLFPGITGWQLDNEWPKSTFCDGGSSQGSLWYILDAGTKKSAAEVMNHVEQVGPTMGFYPNSRPVSNGNGLQLIDVRPDGYQLLVDVYNYGQIEISVRTPCFEWNGF